MDTASLHRLAEFAHDQWRQYMIDQGWRFGCEYNQKALVHDALIDFDRLNDRDQDAAVRGVRMLGLDSLLIGAVEYSRGSNREFVIDEMQNGVQVGWADDVKFSDPVREGSSERGIIDSWTIDATRGELTTIRVHWDDGSFSEHYPSERELRRI